MPEQCNWRPGELWMSGAKSSTATTGIFADRRVNTEESDRRRGLGGSGRLRPWGLWPRTLLEHSVKLLNDSFGDVAPTRIQHHVMRDAVEQDRRDIGPPRSRRLHSGESSRHPWRP